MRLIVPIASRCHEELGGMVRWLNPEPESGNLDGHIRKAADTTHSSQVIVLKY